MVFCFITHVFMCNVHVCGLMVSYDSVYFCTSKTYLIDGFDCTSAQRPPAKHNALTLPSLYVFYILVDCCICEALQQPKDNQYLVMANA